MNKIETSGILERKLSEFSENQKRKIFKNLGAMQLTIGCSIGCPDCGLEAEKRVRDYIPAKLATSLFRQYRTQLASKKTRALYYASDPLDYSFDGKDYFEIENEYKENAGENLCTITAVPRGKEETVFKSLLEEEGIISGRKINAISVTKFNYSRLEKAFKKFSQENAEILPDDFSSEFSEFIKDNPFVRDYYNEKGRAKRHKLGKQNKDNLDSIGIGCFNGVLITPEGVYNIQTVPVTPGCPTGQIKTEITPENFRVITYKMAQ